MIWEVFNGTIRVCNKQPDRRWHEEHWPVFHRPDCHITAETLGVSTSVCSTNRAARQTVQNYEHLPVLPSYHTVKLNFSSTRHRSSGLETYASKKDGWDGCYSTGILTTKTLQHSYVWKFHIEQARQRTLVITFCDLIRADIAAVAVLKAILWKPD